MFFDHVSIAVKDVATSVAFYRKLGFTEIERPAFDFNGAWLIFGRMNGHQLHLIEYDSKINLPSSTRGLHFALRVENIVEFDHKLKVNGIHSESSKTRVDGVVQIFLKDPDGYYWEFNNDVPKISGY